MVRELNLLKKILRLSKNMIHSLGQHKVKVYVVSITCAQSLALEKCGEREGGQQSGETQVPRTDAAHLRRKIKPHLPPPHRPA